MVSPLTVSHFEADSGNLTLHLQEKLAHLREARARSRSWQAQDKQAGDEVEPRGKPLRTIHPPSGHNRKQGLRRSGRSMVVALGRGS